MNLIVNFDTRDLRKVKKAYELELNAEKEKKELDVKPVEDAKTICSVCHQPVKDREYKVSESKQGYLYLICNHCVDAQIKNQG